MLLVMLVNFSVYSRLSRYRLEDLVLMQTSNASMAFLTTQSELFNNCSVFFFFVRFQLFIQMLVMLVDKLAKDLGFLMCRGA